MATLKKEDSQLADKHDKPLIGARQALITAVANAAGQAPTDDEFNAAVAAINAIITVLEAHGLIESND